VICLKPQSWKAAMPSQTPVVCSSQPSAHPRAQYPLTSNAEQCECQMAEIWRSQNRPLPPTRLGPWSWQASTPLLMAAEV
jgi:hypothetical protein